MVESYTVLFRNAIDILLVAFITYQIIRLLRHTRATPVFIGLALLLTVSVISRILQLETVNWIFESISGYILIAMIVILQPELRRIFYTIGQTRWYRLLFQTREVPVDEIYQAGMQLSEVKTGALFVLVNKIGLKHISEGGIAIDAKLTKELLVSIFYGQNPLHDGAIIIEGNQILSAATYLPLSNSDQLKKTHGARHRAGLGISEESDCLALVVSEEKGWITACYLGEMKEKVDHVKLKSLLMAFNSDRLSEEWNTLFAPTGSGKNK
ncbi:MAG: diadenylate cyclase CdaA [Leptospirales bacterium]